MGWNYLSIPKLQQRWWFQRRFGYILRCNKNTLEMSNNSSTPLYVQGRLIIYLSQEVFTRERLLRKLRGTIVNIILPPRVSFYRREIYFAAASFILLPRVLFYCREFCFTAASFILAPRVLYYCREFYYTTARFILPPRVLFSPPRVLFSPLAVK